MDMYPQDKFDIVGVDESVVEHSARKKIGYWQDAWRRLKQNKLAFASLILMGILLLMTIIGPWIAGYDYAEIDSTAKNLGPSAEHWFGTDALGRDMFARVWQAGRVSMTIGIFGAFISTVVGVIYGSISAFFGGFVDNIMMRIVEILIGIPYLIVVILISVITDSQNLGTLLLALTITGWCGTARLVRGQILQLKEQEYVMATNVLGVSPWKIIKKHLIPNTLGLIIVGITFDIPGYIFSEAFLSYIGLGIASPNTSWGALASAAQANFRFYPFQLFLPSLMIALTMLSFTLLGDGLRDALDPRLRQ